VNLFKYIVIAALVITLLMIFRVGIFAPGDAGPELLPDVTADDYQGREVALSAITGKVTLLVFWFPT
jgi:cytochrome oxidase Cu insertion factor (SCO1/SenC/PrrC family)